MPGHCDGESRQEVETVEQEIKNHFHLLPRPQYLNITNSSIPIYHTI